MRLPEKRNGDGLFGGCVPVFADRVSCVVCRMLMLLGRVLNGVVLETGIVVVLDPVAGSLGLIESLRVGPYFRRGVDFARIPDFLTTKPPPAFDTTSTELMGVDDQLGIFPMVLAPFVPHLEWPEKGHPKGPHSQHPPQPSEALPLTTGQAGNLVYLNFR